jgi:hypothetical protein
MIRNSNPMPVHQTSIASRDFNAVHIASYIGTTQDDVKKRLNDVHLLAESMHCVPRIQETMMCFLQRIMFLSTSKRTSVAALELTHVLLKGDV